MRDNAGYVVGQRALGAAALARAEDRASYEGVRFEWETDWDTDLGDHEYWCSDAQRGIDHAHECYTVRARVDDEVLASIGGVIEPSTAYARVIEAELALEIYS